jgi:hypothetical protein
VAGGEDKLESTAVDCALIFLHSCRIGAQLENILGSRLRRAQGNQPE